MFYEELSKRVRRADGLDEVRMAALDDARWLVDILGEWEAADERADRIGDRTEYQEESHRFRDAVDARLKDPDPSLRAMAMCMAFWDRTWLCLDHAFGRLIRRRLRWTAEQSAVLWRLAADPDQGPFQKELLVELGLSSLKGLGEDDIRELAPLLRTAAERLGPAKRPRPAKLSRRVTSYLTLLDGPPSAVPDSVLVPDDAWAAGLREWIGEKPAPELVDLVLHLATLSGPPSQKWRETCVELAKGQGEFGRFALRRLAECEPTEMRRHGQQVSALLDRANLGPACGVVWMMALTEGTRVADVLKEIFTRTSYDTVIYLENVPEPQVATAVVQALGAVPGGAASGTLREMLAISHDSRVRRQIEKVL
ncbi:hypothetical protein GCM10029978_041990 [Actinoallomurus acanthiterrae]